MYSPAQLLDYLLLIVALLCFLAATFNLRASVNLTAAGLVFVTAALLF